MNGRIDMAFCCIYFILIHTKLAPSRRTTIDCKQEIRPSSPLHGSMFPVSCLNRMLSAFAESDLSSQGASIKGLYSVRQDFWYLMSLNECWEWSNLPLKHS